MVFLVSPQIDLHKSTLNNSLPLDGTKSPPPKRCTKPFSHKFMGCELLLELSFHQTSSLLRHLLAFYVVPEM